MANTFSHVHSEGDTSACACGLPGADRNCSQWRKYFLPFFSFSLLLSGLLFDHCLHWHLFSGYLRSIWYLSAYIAVGYPIIKEALKVLCQKDIFNEFTLMSVATLGAIFIGEYPEAVAVMLFYTVGELCQSFAVSKARRSIKALLEVKPSVASVLRDGRYQRVAPEEVCVGEVIRVKTGERVPLDGVILSEGGNFDTSALTGESTPRAIQNGEMILAGMINLGKLIDIRVSKEYSDSSLARILEMVQQATQRKAKTERLIRKLSKIYTPVVFFLALAMVVMPALFVSDYYFKDWLYKALVFLVISCPCALVVSIPLSYFGGIGAASRNGILFKGACYLDRIARLETVVFDKTGTLTKGVFDVQEVVTQNLSEICMDIYLVALESQSSHPIATAIVRHFSNVDFSRCKLTEVEEVPGYGIRGVVDGHEVVVGSVRMLKRYNCDYDKSIFARKGTVVAVAIDGRCVGYVEIADQIKQDAEVAVSALRRQGVKQVVMLSGDTTSIVHEVATQVGIDQSYGNLLPEDKVQAVEQLKKNFGGALAFVGDGINDAPVLAVSDVGIAMGGVGSDVAIEVADVVIQTDHPSKVAMAIKIAKATQRVVMQNIVMVLGVKVLVMLLATWGKATMWEAVFADVGVSLVAILHAVSILKRKF